MVKIDGYSERYLRRILKAERFSWRMTSLLHHFPETCTFDTREQQAELDYIVGSRAALTETMLLGYRRYNVTSTGGRMNQLQIGIIEGLLREQSTRVIEQIPMQFSRFSRTSHVTGPDIKPVRVFTMNL